MALRSIVAGIITSERHHYQPHIASLSWESFPNKSLGVGGSVEFEAGSRPSERIQSGYGHGPGAICSFPQDALVLVDPDGDEPDPDGDAPGPDGDVPVRTRRWKLGVLHPVYRD